MTKFSSLMSYLFLTIFFPLIFFSLYMFLIDYSILIDWHIAPLLTSFLSFPIMFDWMSMLFSSTVIFISMNILKFSTSYMKGDPFIMRFTILVILFIMSMNMLIFFPHMITMLMGWDGLGFTSFILVIYYQNPKSLSAGMITVLTNRIGDVFILVGISLTLPQGHWNIMSLSMSSSYSLMALMIMSAALTKSAQLPFSSWLPAAMAAPTPVSALVHSSTLVTAGVFLLIRFYPILSPIYWFTPLLLLSSMLTMTMSSLAASVEWDLKKVIALSTLSQLGIMMGSLALGFPMLTFFHLITHALFKALLFICAGNIISTHNHAQDLRMVGNLIYQMPVTMTSFLIANMALMGMPFLSGFYSKDLILESMLNMSPSAIIMILFSISTGLTTVYSFRLLSYLTLKPKNSNPMLAINNSDWNFNYSMMDMTLGAIFIGGMLSWMVFFPLSEPSLSSIWKLLPITFIMLGVWLAYYMEIMGTLITLKFFTLKMNSNMWFLTYLSSEMPLNVVFPLSKQISLNLESGWFEKLGMYGLKTCLSFISKSQHLLSSSFITSYSMISLLSISLLMFL